MSCLYACLYSLRVGAQVVLRLRTSKCSLISAIWAMFIMGTGKAVQATVVVSQVGFQNYWGYYYFTVNISDFGWRAYWPFILKSFSSPNLSKYFQLFIALALALI